MNRHRIHKANINNTDNGDALEHIEDHELIVGEDLEDSDHEEETTQTAEDIVLNSLASGALSEVCEVMAVMRKLNKKNDIVKEFVAVTLDQRRHHALPT